MRIYIASLGAGLLVGVVYALINVRSPAPPIVALVGLLGILLGEQIPHLVKAVVRGSIDTSAVLNRQVCPHVFGHLPTGERTSEAASPASREG